MYNASHIKALSKVLPKSPWEEQLWILYISYLLFGDLFIFMHKPFMLKMKNKTNIKKY